MMTVTTPAAATGLRHRLAYPCLALLCAGCLLMSGLAPANSKAAAASIQPFSATLEQLTLRGYHVEAADMTGPRDIVIILHGWHFPGVDAAETTLDYAIALAGHGLTAISISMRGWPPTDGEDDCGYRQAMDVSDLITWLRGRYGQQLRSIGLMGFSQGGQVALLSASKQPAPDYVVAYYPVTDIDHWQRHSNIRGITDEYIPEQCSRPPGRLPRSPVMQASRIASPVMLIHADDDLRVPTQQSVMMAERLVDAGKIVRLEITEGGGHGNFDPVQEHRLFGQALAFIRRHIMTGKGDTGSMPLDPGQHADG